MLVSLIQHLLCRSVRLARRVSYPPFRSLTSPFRLADARGTGLWLSVSTFGSAALSRSGRARQVRLGGVTQRSCLKQLADLGLIRTWRPPVPAGLGRSQGHHTLTPLGIAVVAALKRVDPSSLTDSSDHDLDDDVYLDHRLGIAAFFCALIEASLAHEDHCLLAWKPERVVRTADGWIGRVSIRRPGLERDPGSRSSVTRLRIWCWRLRGRSSGSAPSRSRFVSKLVERCLARRVALPLLGKRDPPADPIRPKRPMRQSFSYLASQTSSRTSAEFMESKSLASMSRVVLRTLAGSHTRSGWSSCRIIRDTPFRQISLIT
jgi:hypothetical protein